MRRSGYWIVAFLALAVLGACGGDDDESEFVAIDQTVRQELAAGGSEAAPDQLLELTRVVIPAGAEIAAHTHPGTQLAFIAEGRLTYTVIDGEAFVTRAAGGEAAVAESYVSGDTLVLAPGDSIHEPRGMVHMASNETEGPVVIYLASLFPEGEPASAPAEE